jgi:hypothetical protein
MIREFFFGLRVATKVVDLKIFHHHQSWTQVRRSCMKTIHT